MVVNRMVSNFLQPELALGGGSWKDAVERHRSDGNLPAALAWLALPRRRQEPGRILSPTQRISAGSNRRERQAEMRAGACHTVTTLTRTVKRYT